MLPVSLLVPHLGVELAKISHWYVPIGEVVEQGERTVELLIPGLTIDLHAPISGRLVERLHSLGDLVRENQPLGRIQPLENS
jgi:pyruvate/2-oxoglutarate dehydrogenase complex dihydrolipoamide acyltransferase (E2) component